MADTMTDNPYYEMDEFGINNPMEDFGIDNPYGFDQETMYEGTLDGEIVE